MSTPIIIGIDLGTTNSEVAFVKGGRPQILQDNGDGIVPSCVGVDPENRLIVGKRARNQAVAFPDRTVLSIKREMGRDKKVVLAGQAYSPQEISAFILRDLKGKAERVMGQPVGHAVITVPAYFTDAQRNATREAGAIAGLEVVRIINEPTAAALAYGESRATDEKRTILVYDLGGGTFDVSIVRIEDQVVEVLASTGDNRLGGDDFDNKIVNWLAEELKREHGLDVMENRAVLARLKSCGEKAKIELSQTRSTRIQEDYIAGEVHLDVTLTREIFEGMIQPDINRTMDSVTRALQDASVPPNEIDRILLVGGSSRIPMISTLLRDKLNLEPSQEIDPDLCVALGAGIQAAREMGVDSSGVLIDITPYTFGTSAAEFGADGLNPHVFVPLINRNTKLPVSHTETFYTMVDNQEIALIQVFQGESSHALDNILIASYTFDLSNTPAGSMITLTYDLDVNGILKLEAVEKDGGKTLNAVIDNVFSCDDPDRVRASQEKINGIAALENAGRSEAPSLQTEMLPGEIAEILTLAREKLDMAPREDRDDIIDMMEDITSAVEENDLERARKISQDLDDLLFYIE
jgi:molecular chaperone DnaK (HSP70)